MDDQINQLDAVVDGSGTADNPTVGDTLDEIGTLGDGSIVSEQYVAPMSATTCWEPPAGRPIWTSSTAFRT